MKKRRIFAAKHDTDLPAWARRWRVPRPARGATERTECVAFDFRRDGIVARTAFLNVPPIVTSPAP